MTKSLYRGQFRSGSGDQFEWDLQQCSCVENSHSFEWYFNPVSGSAQKVVTTKKEPVKVHQPMMDKLQLKELLDREKGNVDALPVRNNAQLTPQQLEVKSYYPRAYEYWTENEYRLLERVYRQCESIDAVASLLKRQPHIVKEKIENMQMLPRT